jgi:hypothetical protein
MDSYSFFQTPDGELRRGLLTAAGASRRDTALVVAHIAEFDARRLYAAEGYPSMYQFCLRELRFSEDAAYKRIHAARLARAFPVIFEMLADGRLHLSAVVMLYAHRTCSFMDELIQDAVHKTRREIELMLAERFPSPDLPVRVRALGMPVMKPAEPSPPLPLAENRDPDPVQNTPPAHPESLNSAPLAQPVETQGPQLAPGRVAGPERPRVAPIAPERYAVQFTASARTLEFIERAGQLLGRSVNSNDLDEALAQGLEALVASIEKRRFAATSKPRAQRKASQGRRIPAALKREVWKRDQGQCTFVAENGRVCGSRTALEIDHIQPVAKGGRTALDNLRLLCRAHNQYEAENAFGAGFMREVLERNTRGGATRRSVQGDAGAPPAPA